MDFGFNEVNTDGGTKAASDAELGPFIRACRSCDASIIWARPRTGRVMPVDAAPADGGNILLEVRQGFVRATVLGPNAVEHRGAQAKTLMHKSHFATCPDADGWRQR